MSDASLPPVRIGSRGSDLALWQANYVSDSIPSETAITIIKTQGDQIQHLSLDKVEGKGFFTKEIEAALLDLRVDVAVHSFKDLPTENPPGLAIAAVPPRAPVGDLLLVNKDRVEEGQLWGLPLGAKVGTSSLRRQAQLKAQRPDLEITFLRGNVPTRLGKASTGEMDAVVLAEAGLSRLGLLERAEELNITVERPSFEHVCPAPAQGALAIQIREDDQRAREAVSVLHDEATARAVALERDLLTKFGGGCHLPLGAYGRYDGETGHLLAVVAAPDGSEHIRAEAQGTSSQAIVQDVYRQLDERGAGKYV